MSIFQQIVGKQKGNPIWLGVSVIGITFGIYGAFRYGYRPWSKKRRFEEAEHYANIIFEKENQAQNTNESEYFE